MQPRHSALGTHHANTTIITAGRSPEEHDGIINPPVYHASTILFPTLAAYELGETGQYPGPTYGRIGTDTTFALQDAIAALEGADHCVLTSSGVAAFTTALLAFLKAGDHLLMVDSVYGPCRRFCDQELSRFGIQTTYYDPLIGAGIGALIQPNTKAVYVESPGSLTFEVQDIPAIVQEAKRREVMVIADSTWATPLYSRAFEIGVDVSLHSVTKYIGGHSDLVMGAICTTKQHYTKLLRTHHNLGACPGPDDCYLAQRGLRTMAVRWKQHEAAGLALAQWLKGRPEVVKVLHPAFTECPGHDIWKRDIGTSNGLFSVVLKPYPKAALANMLDHMELFGMGYSWGGYESLMIPINPAKTRSATPWRHDGIALRLHAGLEHVDDLIRDLENGFTRLNG